MSRPQPSGATALRARLSGALRTRRSRMIAILVVGLLGMLVLAWFNPHTTNRHRAGATPLLAAPSASVTASPKGNVTPSAPASASPSPRDTSNDGAGDDNNPATGTGPGSATITSGPADPTDAAVTFLSKYLNTTTRSPQEWRDNVRPLVTPDLAAQIDQADLTRVPVGIVDLASASVTHNGDAQVQVTLRLVASREQPNKVVDTIVVWLDGTSHRWLASQLDEIKPGSTQ